MLPRSLRPKIRSATRVRMIVFAVACLVSALAIALSPTGAQVLDLDQPSTDALPIPIDRGAAEVWQDLLKLHTRASLMMIVAHPDDEDGGMLTYESRAQGARVVQLTLNRGEGGQNVMSADYWDALGLVRTQELLDADAYHGVEQYFTRVADFGFSKTKEESLAKWGHDRVLADAVRVVRMTRPLVVTSVWVGGPSDGHGQHEVAGEIAQEVFKAAGDPNAFPEQIREGLHPWSPLKMYARTPTFSISAKGMYDYATRRWVPVRFYDYIHGRWINGKLDTNLEIPEGQYDPVLGLTYRQIGAEGLGFQKSQNGGTGIPTAGPSKSPYHRFASAVPAADHESSFFDAIDTSPAGVASLAAGDTGFLKQGLAEIDVHVESAIHDFSQAHPEKIAPELAAGLKATRALAERVSTSSLSDEAKFDVEYELRVKERQFDDAIVAALGLSMRATVVPAHEPTGPFAEFEGAQPTFEVAIPGQQFAVKIHVVNPSDDPVVLKSISLSAPRNEPWQIASTGSPSETLAQNATADARFGVTVPRDASFTRPYFTRSNIERPFYEIVNSRDVGLPFTPYPLAAWLDLVYDGVPIRMGQVVQTVRRVNGPGVVMNPLAVAPAISLTVTPGAGIVPLDAKPFGLRVTVHSNVPGAAKGTVRLKLPQGWRSTPEFAPFSTTKAGEDQPLSFTITPSSLREEPYTIEAVGEYDGQKYSEGYRTVGYTGLRPHYLYRPAIDRVRGVNFRIAPGLHIGYIAGTGDEVPQSLESVGVKVQLLASQDLAAGDLTGYDAIVVGIRAYSVRDDVKTYASRLLDYVKNGGVLIVQYQAPEYDHDYGPYPYQLSPNPELVVDETSKVDILEPQNPALSWPNKITTHDFDGWVEERGHGFMKSWDSHFVALLSTHDPDQDPQKGGLLYARYGKGAYIYEAYALYRQLPEGVPGAYRLMANLVSLAKNPEAHTELGSTMAAQPIRAPTPGRRSRGPRR